jgi:DNA helicase-2/ATP-dependent DNA helicase PcrA
VLDLFSENSTPLLDDLNEPQRIAVTHIGSPLLVVAGAGSGKTRVLTRRIAYLLNERGVRPSEILAITFTNKAAGEMRERVAQTCGNTSRAMWVSTFHSACVRILRDQAATLGMKSSFSIYDMQDAVRLMTIVAKDLGIETKQFSPKFLLSQVSNFKNELKDYETVLKEADSGNSILIAQAYADYQRRLQAANAVDFDDLIGHTVSLLEAFPAVAEYYHRRFRHILVDEYQDTNYAQYRLVQLLVGDGKDGVPPAELCVVGDADQSIYAFRGADIRNINAFEQDFPNAKTVLLEQNYRSTQNILSAANAVIKLNSSRVAKALWSDAGTGPKITIYTASDEHLEADFITKQIDHLSDEHGISYRDVAIFYRTNSQSRTLEEQFMRRGIPYKLIGGTRFYERKEIRDALAYLRAIANPDDEVSLRRILNTPKRGIGDAAESAVEQFARRERITFNAALSRIDEIHQLATRSANALREFAKMMETLRTLDESGAPPSAVLDAVYSTSGLLRELETSKDPQDEVRVENLGELESVVREYEVTEGTEEITLAGFLEKVALVADSDDLPEAGQDAGTVTMMTLHTAKGLEFPVVFLTGMEDGIFPHQRSMGNLKEMEEERRLAYVGITRAMQRLYLTRAIMRSTWGQPASNPASRFLAEIPEELVERAGEEETSRSFASPMGQSFSRPKRDAGPVLVLSAGDRVTHDKFGLGKVVSVAGSGDKAEALIDFGSAGQKRLLLRYAPVEKL